MKRSSILFCFVGPAGSGKTSLSKKLREDLSDLKKIISVTTRPARAGELDSVNYFFVTKEKFQEHIQNKELFEYEQIHENYYGQLNSSIEAALQGSLDVVFDIDIRGANSIKSKYPDRAVVIFILPPDRQALVDRMKARSAIDQNELELRLKTAESEISSFINSKNLVDYCVVNDNFEQTAKNIKSIIEAERQNFLRIYKDSLDLDWKAE